MLIKKILVLKLALILIISSNALGLSISKRNNDIEICNVIEKQSGTYLIENVPYAWQEELIYCEWASIEMALRYYGVNITQDEIMYIVGGGYSAAYQPKIKAAITPPIIKMPLKLKFWTGEIAGGTDDYEFLAQIYGLTFKNIYPKSIINHNKIWDEYWSMVRNFIKNDTPVITGLDPLAWPIYMEIIDLSWTPPKIFAGTHSVLIVGYNETDQTVCIHDPCVGYFNESNIEEGMYHWEDIEVFRRAVSRIYWELKQAKYELLVFENTSNAPLPEKLVAQLVQEKNLKKMEGIESAYDNDFVNKNFKKFGINAIKKLKKDIENILIPRIPLHKILLKINPIYVFNDPIQRLARAFQWEGVNKNRVAELLEEKQDLHPQHNNHSIFLKRESKCWDNLSKYTFKLREIIEGNNSIKSMKLAKTLIREMSNQLADIILIQQMILDLPRK